MSINRVLDIQQGAYTIKAQALIQIQALAFASGTAEDNPLTALCLIFSSVQREQ